MSHFSDQEMRRCIQILESIASEPEQLVHWEDADRRAFLMAAGRVSRPTRAERKRFIKTVRREGRTKKQRIDRAAIATTGIRAARQSPVFVAPRELPESVTASVETPELIKPRACYVCKEEFRKLHFFYDSMCPTCADLNYRKRFQSASLEGRVALITGSRVKIGFQAALKMLRAGAQVIVTTRFPRDAALRYAREPDFGEWQHRLEIYGLDLRHAPSVEIFARYLDHTKGQLDILLNNAAQTVRRPPGFYAPMLELESAPFAQLPKEIHGVLAGHEFCKVKLAELNSEQIGAGADDHGLVSWRGGSAGPGIGIHSPALLSQIPCAYDDASDPKELFPEGKTDADLQQIDLRTMNSWRLTLDQVPSAEMLEVHLVNAVAPFILASKLKPLMMRSSLPGKHIVNVSAMEGQFSRHTKTDKHPHTNMAKAALNMMTLTSAPGYAADGIYMNAVDTGWVTDEDPAVHATRKTNELNFQPPLDIVDGAARICDPFFHGLLTGEHVWGQFLKDYRSVAW